MTLKVRNQDFSIATCQKYVDLPKKFLYGKVLFFTQLSCQLVRKLLKKSWMVSNIYCGERERELSTEEGRNKGDKNCHKSCSACAWTDILALLCAFLRVLHYGPRKFVCSKIDIAKDKKEWQRQKNTCLIKKQFQSCITWLLPHTV